MIKSNEPFMTICPCCGKPAKITFTESEGQFSFGLFHIQQEATKEQLEGARIELAAIAAEEVNHGKNQNS